ncbi:hypothetical protein IMG5_106140, partial [Ichthyophthirius multifiliis]
TGKFLHFDDIQKQTEQILNNITILLNESGTNLKNIVKCTIYLDNMDNFQKMNEIYLKFFNFEQLPVRTCIAVKTLPFNAKIEIEFIAIVP